MPHEFGMLLKTRSAPATSAGTLSFRMCLLSACLLSVPATLVAEEPAATPAAAQAAAETPANPAAPADTAAPVAAPAVPLHQRIDALIAAGTPDYAKLAAPLADDAEFLRRVTLDLTGTIPTAVEARAFFADPSSDKRARLIDRLLDSPQYARQMQRVFDVAIMLRLPQKAVPVAEWQTYLRTSFAANKPWDQMVREILAADGTDPATRAAARFYLDRDGEVNQITRDIGRVFLGVNLECAQCHDHPTIDDYLQEHYYGISAFLVRSFVFKKDKDPVVFAEKAEGEVTFESVFEIRDKMSTGPKSTAPKLFEATAFEEPKFEKGKEYQVKPEKNVRPIPVFSRRALLGPAIASADNVRFRRSIANRLWGIMLGRGLIEPLEFDHTDNPPSHPELLTLLADEMAARKFDIKSMLREIALSQTYQRSSVRPADAPPLADSAFGQALVRPLSPEQLAWATVQAVGYTDAERLALGDKATEEALFARLASVESLFVSLFAPAAGKDQSQFEARVDQALFLANDANFLSWLAPRNGNLSDRLAKLPSDDLAGMANELYISVLTRLPTTEEAADVADYLFDRTADRQAACQELIWALATSAEFRFNH